MVVPFETLVGETLVDVRQEEDRVVFETPRFLYVLYHQQYCCESVYLEDVDGCLSDLIGEVVVVAEELVSDGRELPDYGNLDYTWTFYRIRTHKATVTLRWYGSSNGYYSESVDFEKLPL